MPSGTAATTDGQADSRMSSRFARRSVLTAPTTGPDNAAISGATSTPGHGGQPLWTTSSRRGRSFSDRANPRSNSQTQMIASVRGASPRSTPTPKFRRAFDISPTNGNPCGV